MNLITTVQTGYLGDRLAWEKATKLGKRAKLNGLPSTQSVRYFIYIKMNRTEF